MKDIRCMYLDAGGPFLLLVLFGAPILLFVIVIAVVFFTVKFINKAIKEKNKKD